MRKLPLKQQAPNTLPQSPNTGNLGNLAKYDTTVVVYELIKLMCNAATHVNSFARRPTTSGPTLADLLGHYVSKLEVIFRKKFPSIFVLNY